MAKKFPPGKCAHCLNDFDELTSDHVFPQGWYPDSTPDYLEKWQMPSCVECNNKYSKIESELLIQLGLAIEPDAYKASGISEKVIRAISAEYGKSEKDKLARLNKRKKVIKQLLPPGTIDLQNVLNVEKHNNDYRFLPGIPVDSEYLIALGKKLVKGLTYVEKGLFIPNDYKIDIVFLRDVHAKPFKELIAKKGSEYHCGPGIKIQMASAEDDEFSAAFDIEIWGYFNMYGFVFLDN